MGLKLQVTYKVNLKRAKRKTSRFIVDCLSTKLIMSGLVANREMADCFFLAGKIRVLHFSLVLDEVKLILRRAILRYSFI